MPEEFKAIETQEAFDAAIKSRLERHTRTVTEEVTKKFEGYISPDDARKKSESATKKISELTETISGKDKEIAELTAKNKAFECCNSKLKIATELGIPIELSERLSGETEDEIRKDAENISKYLRSNSSAPQFTTETGGGSSITNGYLSILNNLKK